MLMNTQRDDLSNLAIIVPCYNEEKRFNTLLKGFTTFFERSPMKCEVIFVDDGSSDGTATMVHELKRLLEKENARHTFIQITCPRNRGKGWAIYEGISRAKAPWCLTLDADLSTPPSEILLWEEQGWVDFEKQKVFIASREVGINRGWVSHLSLRRVIGLAYNLLIRIITGVRIRDTQCGFKLYPTALAQEAFRHLLDYGFAHDLEVLIKLRQAGVEIVSLPVHWKASNESKVNVLTDSVRMFVTLLRLRRRYGRNRDE